MTTVLDNSTVREINMRGILIAKSEELRQEAIKHIKALNMFCGDDPHGPVYVTAQIEWIKCFFNISEADLK